MTTNTSIGQSSANEPSKASFLIESADQEKLKEMTTELVRQLDGTPISIIECEAGFFAAVGKNMLTRMFAKEEELIEHLDTWDFRWTFFAFIADTVCHVLLQRYGLIQEANTGEQSSDIPVETNN